MNQKKSQLKAEILNGAPEGIFLKLFENLFSELKQKTDIINTFHSHLMYSAKFDENIRDQLLPRFLSPNVS